jgi:hypothetical protein
MISFTFTSVNLVFLKHVRELAQAEHAKTDAPWRKNPQKIPKSAIRKHCSSENPSHSGRKPLPLGIPTVHAGQSSLPMHPLGQ